MKKSLIALLIMFMGVNNFVRADEGMWIPMLINNNMVEMQKLGLKLSAEDIYSVNHSSLKDAVIIFGGGCTGEIVSPEGLILTNHHCGYGSIQQVSSPENNYLNDGFWAMNKGEEIPVDGLKVQFLQYMKDVTAESIAGVTSDMTETQRDSIIDVNNKKIIETATKDTGFRGIVESFYGGNEYYLFVYEVYTDIRLVGTPPESIGKFGADTDNWMWPRHTGDFSMFRVYSSPEGKPAKYAADNVPLKPKHFLPINIAGVDQGDFAMIMGFPGSTDRYLSSYGVDQAINLTNPTIVDIRAEKLRIMREGMDANEAVRLQYASKFARTANYWKYFIGQTKGLKRLNVKAKKQQQEAEFENWLNHNPLKKEKFGKAITLIANAYDIIGEYDLARYYFMEAIYRGPEILGSANKFNNLAKLLDAKKPDQTAIKEAVDKIKEGVDGYFKDYNTNIDRNLLASMMRMYHQNVPLDQQPFYLLKMNDKFRGDFDKYAEYVFSKSIFASKEKVEAFLAKPGKKELDKDPAFVAVNAFFTNYRNMAKKTKEAYANLAKGNRLFIAGLREMNPEINYAPDANFTMRLTYGTVQDYYPADAIHYEYFTTMDGIMQKEDPNNFEFIVPAKLKELYNASDFGPYGENGVMKVCFLTNHDITGGNSGSPVMNANGELLGLAFDGNWEAMSGDIAFEPKLQRTINVDIRYVLFIIDKFAGAKNLIEEMTIVTEKPGQTDEEIEITEPVISEEPALAE
ncbi:MAG: S46 family peptidase [Bacteroidales bacterium]|nr:S46 family peptidase [Bacteroidales bacterium]